MEIAKPKWLKLTHHEKYLLLQENRKSCELIYKKDVTKEKYFINGEHIRDVPSFYLALGEAINEENGYFGACLDSLDDCLFGGCRAYPPFEIHIFNAVDLRNRLDELAWIRMKLEHRLELFDYYQDEKDFLVEEMKVCEGFSLTGKTFLDRVIEVFEGHQVSFRIYDSIWI